MCNAYSYLAFLPYVIDMRFVNWCYIETLRFHVSLCVMFWNFTSMYFFALSHAPPVLEAEMATWEQKGKIKLEIHLEPMFLKSDR